MSVRCARGPWFDVPGAQRIRYGPPPHSAIPRGARRTAFGRKPPTARWADGPSLASGPRRNALPPPRTSL
eukprot:1831984-Prymnesium_polylepis.1